MSALQGTCACGPGGRQRADREDRVQADGAPAYPSTCPMELDRGGGGPRQGQRPGDRRGPTSQLVDQPGPGTVSVRRGEEANAAVS